MAYNSNVDKTLLDSVYYLANRGFHGDTIARATGLTKSQVYYRTGQLKIHLRAYRDGRSDVAKQFIAVTPCVEVGIRAKRGETYRVAPILAEVGRDG